MTPDGSDYYRQPIPVNLDHTDLKAHLESAVSSTYLHLNAGTCTSVKVGTTGMPVVNLLQNLQTALPEIIKRLALATRRRTDDDEEDQWSNIQSLMIKTSESVSLPIWSCQLGSGEGGRWDGLVAKQGEVEVDEEEHDELPRVPAKRKDMVAGPPEGQGKRRAAEESEGEPKKKRKKKSIGADEVTSEMKGLAIEKAALTKGKKEKTEGNTAAVNGSAPAEVKTKGISLTSVSSKPALPAPGSAKKPKRVYSEEKASRKAEGSLPSVRTIKPPIGTKSDPATADKPGKKAKMEFAPVEAPEPAKTDKPKAERKKDAEKEKDSKLISTQKSMGPTLRTRENEAKPLKSAIKSSSVPEGTKKKKKISFDLKSAKDGKGKKVGGKLSSKERLVGRGPRNT